MTWILAISVGSLFGGAIFMMMQRSLLRLVIGLVLLGHAANLLIFSASTGRGKSVPLMDVASPADSIADPLPQALILTSIVIGFGVLAFALALFRRTYGKFGTDDLRTIERGRS